MHLDIAGRCGNQAIDWQSQAERRRVFLLTGFTQKALVVRFEGFSLGGSSLARTSPVARSSTDTCYTYSYMLVSRRVPRGAVGLVRSLLRSFRAADAVAFL